MHLARTTLRHTFLIVLLAGGLWSWKLMTDDQPLPGPTTVAVTRGDIQQTVLATGAIEANQLVSVGARVSGQIETLAVSLGQSVAEGDLIAQIDSEDQQNAVLQSQAELANIDAQIAATRARLTQAQHDLAREEDLLSSNFTSDESVEAARLNVEIYRAELAALQAQHASAEVSVANMQLALERTRINAPTAGTVVAIVVDEGQTVNASQSTPTIVKIADLNTMVVKAEISEADIVRVQPGQAVSFSILGEQDRMFHGEVREVEPAPSEIETSDTISTDEAVYYNALLEVDNASGMLRIGMTAEVSIILEHAENVLRVPVSAVQEDPRGETMVLVQDGQDNETRPRRVEIGLSDDVSVEVISGLEEGEQIVTGNAAPPRGENGSRDADAPMRMPPMRL